MIVNFDKFNQLDPPAIILCNPDRTPLYSMMGHIYKTKLDKKYNALSTFDFEICSSIDAGLTRVESYDFVQPKRLIHIENEGYFLIDSIEETSNGQQPAKIVKCRSQEAELLYKRFTNLSTTVKFYNLIPNPAQPTIIDLVLALLPTWSAGHIDLTIANKYRTFNITDTTVYSFLMNDCEKAFECVFLFDTENKTINVYDVHTALGSTDIFLSYENLIKTSSMIEITDELVTSLYCTGGGNVSINVVNPLGTSTVYNFDYYKNINWMSQGLIDALNTWESLIATNQPTYAIMLSDYRTKQFEMITLQNELVQLQAEYDTIEGQIKVKIQAHQGIGALNTQLKAKNVEIVDKRAEIVAKQAEIDALLISIKAVNTALSFSTNFTTDQYNKLSEFIIENTYNNANLIVTDLTTTVEYQDTAQELYNEGLSVLSRVSLPRYEFKVDTANFLAIPEFIQFSNQLELGTTVTVDINGLYTIVPVLLEIVLSYDDPTVFTLTFSNRLRLDGNNFQYADLMGQVVTTGSTVAGNAIQWSNWDNNYKDAVSTFITSALDSSKNAVINASNQEIVINGNGLKGRTQLTDGSGGYDPNQVWLTSNLLVFTSDNWDTASLALGQIDYNGNTIFGLVADAVVGKLLAGNSLQITNYNALTGATNFILDENGAVLYNSSFTVENDTNAIIINPNQSTANGLVTQGITIQSKASGVWENVFYTDVQGNLILKGSLQVGDGTIGGWYITPTKLYDTHGNYIGSDGNVKLGGMTLTPGSARFQGDIYANALYGRVVDTANYVNGSIFPAAIDHLDAKLITTGTMIADHIYSGVMKGPGGIKLDVNRADGIPELSGDGGVTLYVNGETTGMLQVRNQYNNLKGYTNMYGGIEFHDKVRVTGGGEGVTHAFTLPDGSVLNFVRGILVDGANGTIWGQSGNGGSGGSLPGTNGQGLRWSPSTLVDSGTTISSFMTYGATLSVDAYLAVKTIYVGDASSRLHVYALTGGASRLFEGEVDVYSETGDLTYFKFPSASNQNVIGFEASLVTGGGGSIGGPPFSGISQNMDYLPGQFATGSITKTSDTGSYCSYDFSYAIKSNHIPDYGPGRADTHIATHSGTITPGAAYLWWVIDFDNTDVIINIAPGGSSLGTVEWVGHADIPNHFVGLAGTIYQSNVNLFSIEIEALNRTWVSDETRNIAGTFRLISSNSNTVPPVTSVTLGDTAAFNITTKA